MAILTACASEEGLACSASIAITKTILKIVRTSVVAAKSAGTSLPSIQSSCPESTSPTRFSQRTLQKLSANNSLFFTSRQLYYFFNERRHTSKTEPLKIGAGCAIIAAIVVSIFMLANGFTLFAFLIWALVIPFSVALLISPRLRKKLSGVTPIPLTSTPQQVEGWYRRWCRINGETRNLLPPVISAATPNAETNNIYSGTEAIQLRPRRDMRPCGNCTLPDRKQLSL